MEIDRISSLPEDLIHQIFSHLSTEEVVRTRSLSMQWKSFSNSFACLNFDQQQLPLRMFVEFINRKLRKLEEKHSIIFKVRLRLNPKNIDPSDVHSLIGLIIKKNVRDFEFEIDSANPSLNESYTLPQIISDANTVTALKLSGCRIPYCKNIRLSQLKKLRLENVYLEQESVITQFLINFPLITELGFVDCRNLVRLEINGLSQLKQLELGFVKYPKNIDIDAPSLEKLLLSEKGISLSLKISEKTRENLRELTILDSSCSGKNFSRTFQGCSKLESLVLRGCRKMCKIGISSQKLKRLVIERCPLLVIADINAPNLSSMKFVDNGFPFYFVETGKLQYYTIESSHPYHASFQQKYLSTWFDRFKNTVRKSHDASCQKWIIFYSCGWCDVVVLECWSSMEKAEILNAINNAATRLIVTNISFPDLAEHLLNYLGFPGSKTLLAISSSESKLYEALKKKPNYSCEYCSSVVLEQKEMDEHSSSTYWQPFSTESINNTVLGIIGKALLMEGMTTTLRATLLTVNVKTKKRKLST